MATDSSFRIPFNDLKQYVPKELRNTAISSLIDNLFNRHLTHDESIPLYGYAGRKPASAGDNTPRVPETTVERDINSVIPVLNFKLGTERITFTVQDLIQRAKALGISPGGLSWLYSQGNNYLPPINLDKFTNFFNYYWVAKGVTATPDMPWNPDLLPEYYTIATPQPADLVKLNVQVATTGPITLTGTGFNPFTFTVHFNDAIHFTITPNGALGAYVPDQAAVYTLTSNDQHVEYYVAGPGGSFKLLEFNIVRDQLYDSGGQPNGFTGFAGGDEFLISPTFLSHNYIVGFNGSSGLKGKVTKVNSLNEYQVIDGVLLREGDRVLVKNNSPLEDGIYVVSPGVWSRAPDFDGIYRVAGAETFVKQGATQANRIYRSISGGGGFGWTQVPGTESNTNHWQEGNYWVHINDLGLVGLTRSKVIQAVRPIIEYASDLQLNSYVQNGVPSDTGTRFRQIKTEFNQLPLFDLYRYDGHHALLASSVFYYVEDLTATLDIALQKRVKKSENNSADFVFNHGMADDAGQLLFVKRAGQLKTIWEAGYLGATIVDSTFAGEGNGVIQDLHAIGFTQQQIWTLTALGPSSFSVGGSKMPVLDAPYDVLTVGTPYNNGEFSCLITAGSIPFTVVDSFTIRIGNLESPRYVHRDAEGLIFDLFGGEAGDLNEEGTWQIPRTFFNNPYNDSRADATEGVLYSHFRGILANQIGNAPIDYSFGGSIKLWSEQQTLLASLLMQRDMTPISMIDLAQRQYETALNNVADIFQQRIIQFLGDHGAVTTIGQIDELLTYIQSVRASDNDVRTVLFDSTSPLVGFPATLPQLGVLPLVEPGISFDNVIGRTLLTHHDGHKSPLYTDDLTFRQSVLGNLISLEILRSDGTYTPAVTHVTQPPHPHRGEVWIRADGAMFVFDVEGDSTTAPPNPAVDDRWYQRSSHTLFAWNGTSWIVQPSINSAWVQVNLAETLNSLLLRVEHQLHDGINPNARRFDFTSLYSDPAFLAQLENELFTYAAANSFDPLGSDYDPVDPFTWNYSQGYPGNFPDGMTTIPSRWFNVLMQHQATVPGVIPTERPNLEPWKLFGFATKQAWWDTLTAFEEEAYTPVTHIDSLPSLIDGGVVRVVDTEDSVTALIGLPIIDGIQLHAGDRVLLQNETNNLNNGVWIASTTPWVRDIVPALVQNTYFTVRSGKFNHDTVWVLINTAGPNDPVILMQVREWTDQLWADIRAAHPTLRLSVNERNDSLLPPYVNATQPFASNALTNFIPPGASFGYGFGDESLVETVWNRSLEHGYSMARALFRYDPLAFLGFCWGFNWVEVDGILYDGFDMNMPGHKRFRLHGDLIPAVPRRPMVVSGSGPSIVATYTAYDTNRKQNFTVKSGQTIIGYAEEGLISSIGGFTFKIDDDGQPFRMGDRFEISTGSVTFVPTASYIYQGFGQTFTHALRETSIDTSSSYAVAAFREWDVNMGYRAGGLVATDDLQVFTDSETLSSSAYSLLFKKNSLAKDEWAQALRISVIQFGDAVEKEAGFAPTGRGEDWIFRVEGYNPRYLKLAYYDMSLVSDSVTFNALTQDHTTLVWRQPTAIVGIVNATLPLTITGIQNVVTFLFGYQKYLEHRGWEFNQRSEFNIDLETGRTRTFQLEIEKFVDRCYAGLQADQGHLINPFIDRAWFNQETGLLAEFIDTSLFDVTGHPGVFDALGVKYKKADLTIDRTNTQSTFKAEGPMFSAHVQIDDFEHIFVFNNFSQPSTNSGTLYDPFSGGRVVTYKFNGRKQATTTMRPEFGGHFLVGHEVHQNMQASTDNVANFFDANRAFENELTSRHSLALLGFNSKKYFDDLDISNKTQFNFWRGLIQAKGTNLSIGAYLNNNRFDDAKVDEYWAYKVAEYGDARQRTFPELKLNVTDALTQFTQLQFDAPIPDPDHPEYGGPIDGFIQITRFEEDRWFTLEDLDQDTYFKAEEIGRFIIEDAEIGKNYTLPFTADFVIDYANPTSFTQLNARTIRANTQVVHIFGYGPARPRFNPIKLFNYADKELVTEVPLWHPAVGQHTPAALESINIISNQNPAKFNYSTQVVDNPGYDPLRPWGSKEIGRVWFDTTNLAYLPYYDAFIFPGVEDRLSRWGSLADFASIDVYEWVQSPVPPTEYNALALSQAGDADLDPQTKAAGQVAGQQTYARDRLWTIRPIAWSFSPVPTDVDWGSTPPFGGGSFNSKIYFESNGTVSLELGQFSDFGISAGMRIGGWNPDIDNPRPVSEYIIENVFSQAIIDTVTNDITTPLPSSTPLQATIEVTSLGAAETSGQLLFAPIAVQPVQRLDVNGDAVTTWDVEAALRIIEVDSGSQEILAITEAIGTVGEQQYVAADPGQPYIAAVAEIPAVEAKPATASIQVLRFGTPKDDADLTGLDPANGYEASLSIDGVPFSVTPILGADIQTFGELISAINKQLPDAPLGLFNGDLQLRSPTEGSGSLIYVLSDNGLFHDLNDFDSFRNSDAGTPFVPAVPAVPEVIGQEYIPPTLEVPYVAAPYLNGATISVLAGETYVFEAPIFKLRITVRVSVTGTFSADAMRNAITTTLADRLAVRNAVQVTPVVHNPGSLMNPISNDMDDPESALNNDIGWRAWSIPTQAQLDADGQQPIASWRPYLGDFATIAGNLSQIQDAVAYALNPLTLNNGTVIDRYSTSWTNWVPISNEKRANTQVTTGPLSFIYDETVDPKRISVYINGLAALKATYTVTGNTVTVTNVARGSEVIIITRRYEPSAAELAFDPDVTENLAIQRQFKQDYEYVSIPVRDTEGALTQVVYYFWVKNKTTAAVGKKQSVQAIAQTLRDGPPNFLTFQHFLPATDTLPARYDAITIAGLSYVITKDDTFKLRFTRNFTLRDDPEELNLKDTHAEWSLMRPNQKVRIPETLWTKLTDSIAGQDAAGNVVPALRRVLYDERNDSRTQFGFGSEQTLAPADLLRSSITYTILNTKLVDTSGSVVVPDYVSFLDLDASEDWFKDAATARQTMTDLWNKGKISQVNEIFFEALNDILANQYELTDVFKTSFLSAHSIRVIRPAPVAPSYE